MRILSVCFVFLLCLLFAENACSLEKRKGYIRESESISCSDFCDSYNLQPDSGYAFTFLKADPSVNLLLRDYVDAHVQVTGYRAGCGGCITFIVIEVLVLAPTAVSPEKEIPRTFLLHQNYPNPFNPATVIGYDLPVSASVTLRVYDLLGRTVSTGVSGVLPPGSHRITWEGGDLPGGVYIYRLIAVPADRQALIGTGKMVLVR